MRNGRYSSILLFLLGAFSRTQVRIVGSMGVSEVVVFLVAPFIFFANYNQLKHDGFMPVIWLTFLTMVGCCVSSLCNGAYFELFIRGFASPYAIFALIVVLHKLLRNNFGGLKWILLGLAVTLILSTFILQPTTELDKYASGRSGMEAVDGVMSSPIFWIGRIQPWVMLPVTGWYYQTPGIYAFFAAVAFAVFAMFTAESGRAAALVAFVTSVLLLVGGKRVHVLQKIKRKFWIIMLIMLVFLMVLFKAYKTAAVSGMLGEKARTKYEYQTKQGEDFLHLLIKGRTNFFACMYEGIRKPIIGYGPWAPDWDGVEGEFIFEYGTEEEVAVYENNRRMGMVGWLGGHSQIGTFWVWYGVFGLLFWLYVIKELFFMFKNRMSVIPQWYGYFVVTIPSSVWAIFFSPFSGRVSESLLIVACLLVKAVHRGRVQLPYDMVREVAKNG